MHLTSCIRFALLLAFVLAVSVASAHAQERRIALVIGNGKYGHVPYLSNPPEDASAIAAALQRLGFETRSIVDADRATMEHAIRAFGDHARNADAALFYYAGHAFQVSDRNLLVPVDARIRDERDLRFETLDLEDVLGQLSGRSATSIVFIDACRDNPFSARLKGATRGVKIAAGPAPVPAAAGALIAFATAPGTVAEDGGGKHSPFTAALLEHLEKPGLEIRHIMGRVRQSVRETTRGRQIPWENSSLEREFYFRGGQEPPAAASVGGANTDAELIFWDSVKNSRRAEEYQAYIERFPEGVFAPLARARMQQFASLPADHTGEPAQGGQPSRRQQTAAPAPPPSDVDPQKMMGIWHGNGTDGAKVLVAFYPTGLFEQRQIYPNGFVLTVTGRWSLRGQFALLEPTDAMPRAMCNASNECRPVPLERQQVPIELRDNGSVLATPYAVMARGPQ